MTWMIRLGRKNNERTGPGEDPAGVVAASSVVDPPLDCYIRFRGDLSPFFGAAASDSDFGISSLELSVGIFSTKKKSWRNEKKRRRRCREGDREGERRGRRVDEVKVGNRIFKKIRHMARIE